MRTADPDMTAAPTGDDATAPPATILVAGIGNIFLGDDAFGVEVAQRLLRRPQPAGVRVVDFGIRGLDLTYALLDGCDVAILVDAVPRGSPPGTLCVIEPDPIAPGPPADASPDALSPGDLMMQGHGMDPAKVLRVVAALGGSLGRVLVVGCEPTPLASEDDMAMGLSPPVEAAIPAAVDLVESLVARLRSGEPIEAGSGTKTSNEIQTGNEICRVDSDDALSKGA